MCCFVLLYRVYIYSEMKLIYYFGRFVVSNLGKTGNILFPKTESWGIKKPND